MRSKLHALVQPVARTTASDLREQGLGKMGFVEDRLGVTASHGTVIVARSLLGAGKVIDAGIDALLAGRPVPDAPPLHFRLSPSDVGKNALRRMTDHLRRCIKPDQESESLGPPRIESDAIAKNNRSSAKLVKTALAQFDRCWPEQAIAALSIDPTIWFS